MPAPAHTKITFSGIFGPAGAPLEQWQFGLTASQRAFASRTERIAVATACKDVYETHFKPIMRTNVVLTRVRVAQVEDVGRVQRDSDGSYNQGDWIGSQPGTVVASNPLPLQTALTVSLETTRPGAQGKGRFYLPWPAFTLETDFRLSAANAQNVCDRAALFVAALDAAVDGGGANPTTKISVPSSYGFLSPVVAVKVGRVPDTQRRRRGDLNEEYVRTPVNQ